jgi:hypothetical protein
MFLRLFWLAFLGIAGLPGRLPAQPDNGQVFRQLVEGFLKKEQQAFRSIEGEWPLAWRPAVQADSSLPVLQLNEVWVEYQALKSDRYQRTLRIPLSWQDSLPQTRSLAHIDTLALAQLRRLRRASPRSLRGDAPGWGSRWLQPLIIVSGSIASLVALFYIRSQN